MKLKNTLQEKNIIKDNMQRKNIIVLLTPNEDPVTRGNFKKLCEEFGLPYHYLKPRKFPIEYKDFKIYKVEFR